MARKRINYGDASVYIGENRTTGNLEQYHLTQISRVQGCDLGISSPKDLVSHMGSDTFYSAENQPPVVSFGIDYFPTHGGNEKAFGMVTDGTKGAFSELSKDERHMFVRYDPDNENESTMCVGHSVLTSYGTSCQLGRPMESSVNFSAFTVNIQDGASGFTPLINIQNGESINNYGYSLPEYSEQINEPNTGNLSTNIIVRPSSITLSYPSGSSLGSDINNVNEVQVRGFDLSATVPRANASKLRFKYPFLRTINYPIEIDLSTTLSVTNKSPAAFLDSIRSNGDIKISISDDNYGEAITTYTLKGADLVSHEETLSVNGGLELSLQWRAYIGGSSSMNNFIISGFGA